MNARSWIAGAIGLAALIGMSPADADGIMLPDAAEFRARRERAMIHEPEQKAAIIYGNGIEDLIISPRYEGPAKRFAWIIPVPTRPTAEERGERSEGRDRALFHELARLTEPVPVKGGRRRKSAGAARTQGVEVLERKQVGAYDVAALRADDAKALMRWLEANGFAITPADGEE
ncbi:MAG: DUF2330 domain-containing protein [Armatimonadetes bacterium]|nr:DUF2330 domain-containing protein [Armatimonadota bacterium]